MVDYNNSVNICNVFLPLHVVHVCYSIPIRSNGLEGSDDDVMHKLSPNYIASDYYRNVFLDEGLLQ